MKLQMSVNKNLRWWKNSLIRLTFDLSWYTIAGDDKDKQNTFADRQDDLF
jgi:hypothetical protein